MGRTDVPASTGKQYRIRTSSISILVRIGRLSILKMQCVYFSCLCVSAWHLSPKSLIRKYFTSNSLSIKDLAKDPALSL
jgi:hypothetical protein